MAVQTITKDIGENQYQFTTFTAGRGLKYLRQLTVVIGPSASAIMSEGTAEETPIERAMSLLVDKLDNPSVETLIKDLVADVVCNGSEVQFDLHFAANYGELFELLVEVVKENYGSVFTLSGLGGLSQKVL